MNKDDSVIFRDAMYNVEQGARKSALYAQDPHDFPRAGIELRRMVQSFDSIPARIVEELDFQNDGRPSVVSVEGILYRAVKFIVESIRPVSNLPFEDYSRKETRHYLAYMAYAVESVLMAQREMAEQIDREKRLAGMGDDFAIELTSNPTRRRF